MSRTGWRSWTLLVVSAICAVPGARAQTSAQLSRQLDSALSIAQAAKARVVAYDKSKPVVIKPGAHQATIGGGRIAVSYDEDVASLAGPAIARADSIFRQVGASMQ